MSSSCSKFRAALQQKDLDGKLKASTRLEPTTCKAVAWQDKLDVLLHGSSVVYISVLLLCLASPISQVLRWNNT